VGRPVVHFEIVARDARATQRFFSELFDWEIENQGNHLEYGTIDRERNLSRAGFGIGGGIGRAPAGYDGHVTFYVEVPDVEEALARAEALGGARMMGPERVTEQVEIGLFTDPEGHVIGLFRGA